MKTYFACLGVIVCIAASGLTVSGKRLVVVERGNPTACQKGAQ